MEGRAQPPRPGGPPKTRAQENADAERGYSPDGPARSARQPLERLHGDREGQHSIRINDQYRICFEWRESNAFSVEITDYH